MNARSVSPARNHERSAARFLRSVFGDQQMGVLALFGKPSRRSIFIPLSRDAWYNEAAKNAIFWRETEDVYFSIGLQGEQPQKGRGKQDDVIAIPGFWADIDVKGPNHAAANLPPTLEDARSILQAIPFKPTVVVYSGGGLQAYWLFREPLETKSQADRLTAKQLSKSFQAVLRNIAGRQGWAIDGTADLCRLLRLPGTYNRKQTTPALITYEVVGDRQRYNPSDFQEFVELEANPEIKAHVQGAAPDNPTADSRLVLGGCHWMRHCKDDAAKLPEPEWYRMLSILGRCKDARRIAHDLSKPYPRYNTAETEHKLQQAMGAAGPTTCTFIETELGQEKYCKSCIHRGRIKSPIVLGIQKKTRPPANGPPAAMEPPENANRRLPEIQITDRQLRDMTGEAVRALVDFNNPPCVFVHAGRAVRVTAEEEGRYVIADATEGVIRNLLTQSADFYEVRRDGVRNCPPPMDVVKDLLAMPPVEWRFPTLLSVIASPSLREDGSLIQVPGYDPASRLFYAPDPGLILSEIPEEPTTDHVQIAADLILDVLADFPFVDAASRANAVGALLTPICRPAIKGPTPLALFDATTQGTGKTLLAEIVSLIVCGREGALFSAPRDAEEWRKQLTSVLRDGSPIVIIDNVNYRLDSAELCKALTESIHADRILGQSQIVNLPVRCTWIATGNNIQLGGDMSRRCYWVRMDAKCPRPFERTAFRYKRLKQHVLAHRSELLSALLTLARSWFVAGCTEPTVRPVGSFEDWTTTIGGILQHGGIEGFLANSGQLYEQADTESTQWEALLNTLNEMFYGDPFTVAQVWERIHEKEYINETNRTTSTERSGELRAVLPDFVAQVVDREGFFKQRLGFAFRERVGRRYGTTQVRIERVDNDRHGKVARWKVEMNA